MEEIDWDGISIPADALFLPEDMSDDGTEYTEDDGTMSRSHGDEVSLFETESFYSHDSGSSGGTLRGHHMHRHIAWGQPRACTIQKGSHEEHGFFLAIDRDRNGNVVRRVERGSPADRAGLRDGDRILELNGEDATKMRHEDLVEQIKMSGNEIHFRVIDERSDDIKMKNKPYLFRIVKGKGGYGFYLWQDTEGHFVEDITISSPADRAGLRAGDRIIEINGVNIEEENHEDVFYRIKACHNVVNLLAVDAKTFAFYKKNNMPVTALKAETKFSGWKGFAGFGEMTQDEIKATKKEVVVNKEEFVVTRNEGEEWGFKLAFSNSFMGNEKANGHMIHWVEKGGPADSAGLRNGDKLVGLEGISMEKEEYEKVQMKLEKHKGTTLRVTIAYEEIRDAMMPHDVEIDKGSENSFGFYLWFDENGHYIEDVTIGSPADKSGLKIGDRVVEVNHSNVENEIHENVVAKVQESGDIVTLNVVSVRKEEVGATVKPVGVTLEKGEGGSFGFYIQHDSKGFYFEYVQLGSPADKAGISTGDRLLEVNGESTEGKKYEDVFSMVRNAGNNLNILMQSTKKARPSARSEALAGNETAARKEQVYRQLLGLEEIDYTVEKRFLQLEYEKKHGIVEPGPTVGGKRGTDLRGNKKKKDGEKKRRRRKKDKSDIPDLDDNDGTALLGEEDETGGKKKKRRRKKKTEGEDGASGEGEGKKRKKKRKPKTQTTELGPDGNPIPKKEMSLQSKKEALAALKKKTKEQRDAIIQKETGGSSGDKKKKKKRRKEGASSSRMDKTSGENWDWDQDKNRPLEVVAEEPEPEMDEVQDEEDVEQSQNNLIDLEPEIQQQTMQEQELIDINDTEQPAEEPLIELQDEPVQPAQEDFVEQEEDDYEEIGQAQDEPVLDQDNPQEHQMDIEAEEEIENNDPPVDDSQEAIEIEAMEDGDEQI